MNEKLELFKSLGIELYHGDMFDVIPMLEPRCDLIFADLPYGVTECKWDKKLPYEQMWDLFYSKLLDRRAILLNASNPFLAELISSNPKGYCYDYYWNKKFSGSATIANLCPMRTIEPIGVFSKDSQKHHGLPKKKTRLPRYFPIKTLRDVPITLGSTKGGQAIPLRGTKKQELAVNKKVYHDKHPTNYIEISVREDRGFHPTSKPIRLFEYFYKTFTLPGETVLDPCMGAGPSAIAAYRTGRKYVGIEIDPEYFEIAVSRLYEEVSQTLPLKY